MGLKQQNEINKKLKIEITIQVSKEWYFSVIRQSFSFQNNPQKFKILYMLTV